MAGFEITLKMPELPATIAAFEVEPTLRRTMINDTFLACGKILRQAIKEETPVRTGKLRGSTYARIRAIGGDQQLAITQTAKTTKGVSYGVFVREGTQPHEIRPSVMHPGTQPNHYPERAYQKVSTQIEAVVANINQRTAERLGGK